jgi:RNA polymerase sigma factor (sigma-70 family)
VGRGTMVLDAPAPASAEAPEGPTDLVLVAAVRRGDDRAFEQLYTRYQRRIAAYVYGMVKDYGRAEDITQEVFISALRRMRETERPIAFKPWVYEIAKNACIDQFRRSRRAEEISMDAGDGLAHSDHGRLVAGEPSPDAAVDAKQQLDHLCGAFGGLSDSHHEILVLREFEGLSYREIGERMGLSRPGVESTLFRARKRLTEEYDELVSGARCTRIQSIIAAAGATAPGARDSRRLARHIAHCQPCRRQAMASGLDVAAMKPARRRVVERVAGLLPLPGFLRSRVWAGGEQIVPVSEPMAAAWSKAVAAAATLIVASVGAGVAPHGGGSGGPQPAKHSKPASTRTSAAPAGAQTQRTRPASATRRSAGTRTTTSRARSRRRASLGGSGRTAQPRGTTAPRSGDGSGSGDRSTSTVPTAPAAVKPGAGTSQPTRGVRAPATGGGTDTPTPPQLPSADVPLNQVVSPNQVGGQVTQTVEQAGTTVTETTGAVKDTVDTVTGSVPDLGG